MTDFSERPAAAPKWVTDSNPYRQAFVELIEALREQEKVAGDAAQGLGPRGTPARTHEEGRAHAFRDAVSMVQRYWPPEMAGKFKGE